MLQFLKINRRIDIARSYNYSVHAVYYIISALSLKDMKLTFQQNAAKAINPLSNVCDVNLKEVGGI